MMFRALLLLGLLGIPAMPVAVHAESSTCQTGSLFCDCDGTTAYDDSGSDYVTESTCKEACVNNGASRYDLYCLSESGATLNPAGGATSISDKPEVSIEITKSDSLRVPDLIVDIPGVDLEDSLGYDDQGNIVSNLLPTYISGVYKFLIPVMSMVAVVILMVSGLQYILARGNMDQIKKAKQRMGDAVVGLILLLVAFNIGLLIDPNTVNFSGLVVAGVEGVPLETAEAIDEYGEANEIPLADTVNMVSTGHLAVTATEKRAGKIVYENLVKAADDFYEVTATEGSGLNILVTSGSRTITHQMQLYYQNCIEGSCGTPTCNPLKGVVSDSQLADMKLSEAMTLAATDGDAGRCYHTNNSAVDVWPTGTQGKQFDVSDMDLLTLAMQANGFCRIDSEPWHFELKTNSSSTCHSQSDSSYKRSGKTYSTKGCARWDADIHQCIQTETTQ